MTGRMSPEVNLTIAVTIGGLSVEKFVFWISCMLCCSDASLRHLPLLPPPHPPTQDVLCPCFPPWAKTQLLFGICGLWRSSTEVIKFVVRLLAPGTEVNGTKDKNIRLDKYGQRVHSNKTWPMVCQGLSSAVGLWWPITHTCVLCCSYCRDSNPSAHQPPSRCLPAGDPRQPRPCTLYLTTEARSLGLSHTPFVVLIAPT